MASGEGQGSGRHLLQRGLVLHRTHLRATSGARVRGNRIQRVRPRDACGAARGPSQVWGRLGAHLGLSSGPAAPRPSPSARSPSRKCPRFSGPVSAHVRSPRSEPPHSPTHQVPSKHLAAFDSCLGARKKPLRREGFHRCRGSLRQPFNPQGPRRLGRSPCCLNPPHAPSCGGPPRAAGPSATARTGWEACFAGQDEVTRVRRRTLRQGRKARSR